MKTKKFVISKMIILTIFIVFFNFESYAIIFGNGSGGGYEGGGGANAAGNCGIDIEMLVVEGAGHYLKAHADVLLFLNRVEMSGANDWNTIDWNTILQSALTNMYLAVATYDLLVQTAEVTPYIETVILKLKDFDYNQYMIEQGLNPFIFQEVEVFLGQGNITGMYKRISANLKDITGVLKLIKEDVSLFKMPPLSRIWKLNEMCSHTLIFGQYAARVFAAL